MGQEADETDADEAAAETEEDSDDDADEAADVEPEPEPEPVTEPEPEPVTEPAPEPEPEPEPEPAPVGPITTDDAERDVDLVEEDEPDVATAEGEVIELTGTLIRRQELTTAAPLTVMDRSEIEATGRQSIGDVLQQLPSQSNAINTQFNNGGSGATRVNMCGLGTSRTLVLVNGRRHVQGGTGANASVDLNSIPNAVIERVEVLKDGASAIYGTDAIGGVVNIITRDDFDGTEATLFTGTSQYSGATSYDASIISGVDTDHGNIVFSAGYHDQDEMMIPARDFGEVDRSFAWDLCEADESGRCQNEDFVEDGGPVVSLGSSAVPEGAIFDRLGSPGNEAWQRALDNNPSGAYYNDPNAGWRDGNFGAINYQDFGGDAYNYQPENYLVTPQRRFNLYSSGRYELHDRVDAFFEASHVNRRSQQLLAPEPLFTIVEGLTVSGDNVYNPFGRDFIDVRRRVRETGPRLFSQDVDTSRVVLGLRGDLPEVGTLENWHWSVNYNFGRNRATTINEGRMIKDNLEEAIGASFIDDAGVARCGTPDNPGDPDCVPLNLFGGEGTITQDMLDYVTYTGVADGFNRMNSFQANVSGKLIDTPWDGDVSLAVGAEYRDLSGGFQPDPITAAGNTTGNAVEPTRGSFDVREGFAELSALPVVGQPMAEWVEIKAAARVFDYSTFGTDWTWETGALWQMDHGVSVRGTYSTAFVAPGIGALFSGAGDAFPLITDPCSVAGGLRGDPVVDANCNAEEGIDDTFADTRAQQRAQVGGNPELTPETADIFTAGAVYEPEFVDGLSFTADYFNIQVRNAIGSLGASTLLNACYTREDQGAGIVPGVNACDRVHRDSQTGLLEVIEDQLTNFGDDGGVDTSGVDLAARYTHQTDFGVFGHSLEATWLQKYNVLQQFLLDEDSDDDGKIRGKGVYDLGVRPSWRANFSTSWGYDAFGAGTNFRYIHSIRECQAGDCQDLFDSDEENPAHRRIDANFTADVFGSYTFDGSEWGTGQSRLTLGINNVFDQDPPYVANGFTANSEPSAYDFLGRYFYLRFTQTL